MDDKKYLHKNVAGCYNYLSGSFMWMYRSKEMAHKFNIDAVEHITSKATHVSQN